MQVGVFLSKELMAIAGRSLKANITTLGPLVLPWTEQARFMANFFARKVGSLHHSCQHVIGVLPCKAPYAVHLPISRCHWVVSPTAYRRLDGERMCQSQSCGTGHLGGGAGARNHQKNQHIPLGYRCWA